ncbi:hypothetical protein [Streptomyces sp. RKAG293]|uniref:hypothetical protein n=1 Tax=Streptomyces sp. RKAG293 TaxID=2893403 RepID=UPI0020337955|nr:hypothetical protein [Streptomyces sp. RKAG293]MCM2424206.1 hypothetical protein [Streptomyces sp. RKAG293]
MADDDAGGTVYGFPGGLTIPGPVGSTPPPGAAAPSLPTLPALAPPPSLLVAGNSSVGGGSTTTTANADPGLPDSPDGPGIAAMSVVMMAGITVAAMRGAWNATAYLKARHEHHRAIADQQRAAADKASIEVEAARQKGRLQSGPEFGRGTRTAGGGGGRTNSGKNNIPNTFRSSGGSKPPGGGGGKTPNKTPGGGSGGRTPTLGSGGQGGSGGGRRSPLESSGAKGGGKPGIGGGRTPTTGTRNNSGGLSGAVRDRAADRIRNGPKPKSGTGTLGTSGKSGSGGTTPSSGSKSGRGPGSKTGTTGTKSGTSGTKSKTSGTGSGGKGRVTLPEAVATAAERRLKKRRKRLSPPVLTTVRKAKGKKGAGKPGSGRPGPKRKGKGRVTLAAAIAKESARRLKKRRKRLDPPVLTTVPKGKGKKSKKPKAGTPGAGGTAATPKVSLTKKPKPSSGGPAGPGGTAPKVNLRKKVRLTKRPRHPGSGPAAGPAGGTGTTGPKSTGPTSTGPKSKADKSSTRRGWWERASSRRSGRSEPDPPSTSTGTTPGPGAAPGGGFGPPPGWGYAEGTTTTVEQAGGHVWEARQRDARRRAGVAAGVIPASRTGGTGVSVPVPTRAPSTQYADSDLTIYDVIDSDADMAEEIMAGVDEANAAAEGCEKMMTKLEALHQKIVDLKVPGVLEGWVLILAEKAVSVKAKAEALAEKLPAASEAIRTAGENAERRHKPLADVTRDHGHAAPAERDYHVE